MVIRKSPDEVSQMALAGALLAEVNDALRDAVEPGMSTRDLDDIAAREIAARGAKPSFLGHNGFPATICTAIGAEIVHGIPSDRVHVKKGDVLSIDCGLVYDGFHADAACTWIVGGRRDATEATERLVAGVYAATWAGIAALAPGNRLGDVSYAIQTAAERYGLGVIYEHNGARIGGHGIGTSLHEDPMLPGRGRPGRGMRLRPGLVFAIEPMVCLGVPGFRLLDDGWTLRTVDGSLAAHWEHTVAVTEEGPWVLTARAGEEARPTPITLAG